MSSGKVSWIQDKRSLLFKELQKDHGHARLGQMRLGIYSFSRRQNINLSSTNI